MSVTFQRMEELKQMTYAKPGLRGYWAIGVIQSSGNPDKFFDFLEPPPRDMARTDPAYEADE